MKALMFVVMGLAVAAHALGQTAAPVAAPTAFQTAQQLVEILSQVMFGLMIVASALVRTPWLKKNAGALDGVISKVLRLMTWLPTLGIDPRTKALETALKDIQAQKTPEAK